MRWFVRFRSFSFHFLLFLFGGRRKIEQRWCCKQFLASSKTWISCFSFRWFPFINDVQCRSISLRCSCSTAFRSTVDFCLTFFSSFVSWSIWNCEKVFWFVCCNMYAEWLMMCTMNECEWLCKTNETELIKMPSLWSEVQNVQWMKRIFCCPEIDANSKGRTRAKTSNLDVRKTKKMSLSKVVDEQSILGTEMFHLNFCCFSRTKRWKLFIICSLLPYEMSLIGTSVFLFFILLFDASDKREQDKVARKTVK